jgi:ribosome-associated protein
VSDDLAVNAQIVIPNDELNWTFSPSGGPGGQHANRSNTRAELRFDLVATPSIDDALKQRMIERLEHRLVGGALIVVADETRSQWRNRQLARRRLSVLLGESARPPAPARRATKPSKAARRRRLESKRRRAETKRLRGKPDAD